MPLMASPPTAFAAPIGFNTALPVAAGEVVARVLTLYNRSGDDPTLAARRARTGGAAFAVGWGLTPDLALFGATTLLDKRLNVTLPAGIRTSRRARGFGDTRLFARYTAYKNNFSGGSLRFAPFVGIEIPTGRSDEADALGRLPPALQLGSGSWDPFAGLITTYQVLDYQIDAQISYQRNGTADGFAFGDETRFDLSLQYRLWPRRLGGGTPAFLYAVVETNAVHRQKNRIAGRRDPASGGTQVFVSPGIQYVTKRTIAEAAVTLPLLQDLSSGALKDRFAVRGGLRINF
jgi:hypothetical protein